MNTLKPVDCPCRITLILATILLSAGSAFAKYSGGTGAPDDPYQIGDVNDLLLLGEETGDYDKYFILIADIDLDPNLPGNRVFDKAVIVYYDPLYPDIPVPFTGIFDGNDHKIRNLTINGGSILGLFGSVYYAYTDPDGCEIKNLGLENVYINGLREIGSLAGGNTDATIRNCYSKGIVAGGINCASVGGLVGYNLGDIINCYSEGVVSSARAFQPAGSGGIGGLVGSNSSSLETSIPGTIIDSWSSCDVIGGDGAGGLGGLAGGNGGEFGSIISNCYSTGTVRGYNSGLLGGLVGGNGKGIIRKCFSTSPVIGVGATYGIGGLVGYNGPYSEISNCFSTGDVNAGNNSQRVGGLVGTNESYGAVAKIINCYSAGDVNAGSGSSYVGGMVGYDYYGEIDSSYFLDISGPNNNLGTPLNDTQMKQKASFIGWDFRGETINGTEDIWWINEGMSYPKLVWYWFDPNNPPDGVGGSGNDPASMGGCFPKDDIGYLNWVSLGRPECWCNPRQCHGDADGKKQLQYWVGTNDLNIYKSAQGKLESALPPRGICADFDHKKQLQYWVGTNDLNIYKSFQGKLESDVPVCFDANF